SRIEEQAELLSPTVRWLHQNASSAGIKLGFYFIGIKKCYKGAPHKALDKVSSTYVGNPMYTMCWADRGLKTIVSSRGTTPSGSDIVRPLHGLIKRD
ncbi:hypothetical protein GN958_ATG07561, partial [Phytophthora infestans]